LEMLRVHFRVDVGVVSHLRGRGDPVCELHQLHKKGTTKVAVVRESHKLFLSLTGEFA
jgi:hypothetical protein